MSTIVKTLKMGEDEIIPRTKTSAVSDSNNVSLDVLLADAGKITDVKVNGSSVVTDKVANLSIGDSIFVSDGTTASATVNADTLNGNSSSYFINADSQTLTSAKAYSDTNLQTAKTYSNTNLQTAKDYCDYLVTGTLATGETSITISDTKITTSSALDFYTSIYGASPKTATVSDGSVTLTFKAQSSDMIVGVKIGGTL